MAESETPEGSPGPESKTQREARLRRERRNAKIQAGGSERLNKISSMSGRPAAAEAELAKARASQPQDGAQGPPQVDITNMFQKSPDDPNQPDQQNVIRRMLREKNATEGAQSLGNEADDTMARMMQQMLGGPDSQGANEMAGEVSKLAGLFGQAPEEQESPGSADYMWRIVHAIFSILLGLYAVSFFAFTGTELSRKTYLEDSGAGPRLFGIFATAEVVLQSMRFYMDRGRLPASSMLSKIAQFLPDPYAGYVRVLRRYSVIYTTIASDAFVIVFVLGVMAWWRGLADV